MYIRCNICHYIKKFQTNMHCEPNELIKKKFSTEGFLLKTNTAAVAMSFCNKIQYLNPSNVLICGSLYAPHPLPCHVLELS